MSQQLAEGESERKTTRNGMDWTQELLSSSSSSCDYEVIFYTNYMYIWSNLHGIFKREQKSTAEPWYRYTRTLIQIHGDTKSGKRTEDNLIVFY